MPPLRHYGATTPPLLILDTHYHATTAPPLRHYLTLTLLQVDELDNRCPAGYYCPLGTAEPNSNPCKPGAKCPEVRNVRPNVLAILSRGHKHAGNTTLTRDSNTWP